MTLRFATPLFALLALGCTPAESADSLTIVAAASAADLVTALAETFDDGAVRASFGPSSGLARQIADGLPADLYISASRHWVDYLRRGDQLLAEARAFCRNRLVCVASPDSALAGSHPADLESLLAALADDDRVAIADAGVPAGEYARQALLASGELPRIQPHLVGQEDVRATLRAVRSGQAVAGIVYATDARLGGVVELFTFPASGHQPIEYFIAIPVTCDSPELAARFVAHLASPESRRRMQQLGFQPLAD